MLSTIIDGDFEKIVDQLSEIDETDQDFIVAVRYLVETNNLEMLNLVFENKSVEKMNDRKIVALAAECSLEIFEIFEPLFGHEFPVEGHPLISACSTGNTEVAKYIVELIRDGKLKSSDPHKLKDFAIKVAARKGYVSILMHLCKTKGHVHNAIASLITNGNHRQVPRMLSHPEIDFSHNDFELLKLCSIYIVELMEISRHKSVYENYDRLPADYYRHIVDASKYKFEKTHKVLQVKHKANVKRTAGLILTGARTGGTPSTKPLLTQEEIEKLRASKSKDTLILDTRKIKNTSRPLFINHDSEKESFYEKDEPMLEHEFAKRGNKSVRTGEHVNLLHEITQRFHKSAKTSDDVKQMVHGVHKYHKHDYDRELRARKLDKFVL